MTALTSRVVLFADVAGSMELFANRGIESATDMIGKSLTTCQQAILAEGGQVVKFLGDGVLAVFTEATSAARAALEIQRTHPSGEVRFKIGIDAGPVIDKDNDLFGDPVGLASRICDKAHAGEIFASAAVIARTGNDIIKRDQNYLWLKGYPVPVNIFSIEHDEADESTATKFVFARSTIPSNARLEFTRNGATIFLGPDHPQVTVGRESADLIIPRGSVSREHATIRWSKGDGFVLQDTSKNGTYLRMNSGEIRHIHRNRSPLDAACAISFGEEPQSANHDVRFELVAQGG